MIEWVLEICRILSDETSCTKYSPRKYVLPRNLENTGSFEAIREKDVCKENVLGLSINPGDSDKDEDITIH